MARAAHLQHLQLRRERHHLLLEIGGLHLALLAVALLRLAIILLPLRRHFAPCCGGAAPRAARRRVLQDIFAGK